MASIEELKRSSGAHFFASILGKSTISKSTPEYAFIVDAVGFLISHGVGIIHWGYAGGAMSAASDTAVRLIQEAGLPRELNIGVPQLDHDGLWQRVEGAVSTNVAKDIFDRLSAVTSGDIVVICPLGGDGTELEETTVFHENVIRISMGKKPVPLLFLMTSTGTDWESLIRGKMSLLATSVKDPNQYPWLYFVRSLRHFEEIVLTYIHHE